MIHYAVTTDFEVLSPEYNKNIFVDIESQMITPGRRLLNSARNMRVNISYMLDIIQYERFHTTSELKEPVKKLDEFLLEIVDNGSDIQIHGHSEWVTMKFDGSKWTRQWPGKDCIHEIIDDFFKIYDLAIFRLKNLLGKNWEPLVFRAGGYNIDPTKILFPELIKRGIIADCSRHTLSYGKWWIEDGLIEIPIHGEFPTKNNRWDLNLGNIALKRCFEKVPSDSRERYYPLVMMGHTKLNHNFKKIRELFKRLKNDKRFICRKISNIAKDLHGGVL